MVPTRIKQISTIEPGWRYCYLVQDGELMVCSSPIVGQAVVSRHFPDELNDGDGREDRIEFVVYDDQSLQIISQLEDIVDDGQNTYPIGIKAPGEPCELNDVPTKTLLGFKKKMQENGYIKVAPKSKADTFDGGKAA